MQLIMHLIENSLKQKKAGVFYSLTDMSGVIALACLLFLLPILWKLVYSCYLKPMKAYKKLREQGFSGPIPRFPFGNRAEMLNEDDGDSSSVGLIARHDNVHSSCMPLSIGKKLTVCVYWIGTEPFVYVADTEFLKQLSEAVATRDWAKPALFTNDRQTLFGKYGMNMLQGDAWAHHRRIIGPAFSSSWLKLSINTSVECTNKLSHQWATRIATSGEIEIDIERDISYLAADIAAQTHFGIDSDHGKLIYTKLRAMQFVLFKNMFKRYLGVPFGQILSPKETLEAIKLGNEIDNLFRSIISSRKKVIDIDAPQDFLGLMLAAHKSGKGFVDREVIDECKTFFFAGSEITNLALSWTLMLLAMNKRWQDELREEIKQVAQEGEFNFTNISRLEKMGWVMNEVLRLYPPPPNAVRCVRDDIKVGETTIPEGTNIWIDILGMHHDPQLWGDSVHEFRPERFRNDPLHGGCRHKMGYLPFGFGGRMCVGKTYAVMTYKTLLCSLLSRFSFSVSPYYRHSPLYFFTLRPAHGIQLIVEAVQD